MATASPNKRTEFNEQLQLPNKKLLTIAHPKIINLSKRILTRNEIQVIRKGMKFTPTPKSNDQDLEISNTIFCRKLRLQEHFINQETLIFDPNVDPIVKNKSQFNPPPSACELIENTITYINKTTKLCSKAANNNSKTNFTDSDWKTLNYIRKDKSIIIKEADKGSAIVIMDSDFYRDKIMDLLNDHLTYNKISDTTTTEANILKKIIKLTDKYNLLTPENKFLIKFEPKISYFYGLPKIHKSSSIIEEIKNTNDEYIQILRPDDLLFRPIVAGHSCATSRLSHFLDELLKPFLLKVCSYIKDTYDFLSKLPSNVPEGSTLVTYDVVSLYTNITNDLGIEALKFWLEKFPDLLPERISKNFILEGTNIVLTNNVFDFNTIIYLQIKGCAMGTKMAPTYATLTMGYLEEKYLYPEIEKIYGYDILMSFKIHFNRFLDDIFNLNFPHYDKENKVLEILNNMNEYIKFTAISSNEQIDFLDLTVILKETGKLETDIHYKKTDGHQYLHFSSCHPSHTKRNIPYNMMKRIARLVSNEERKEYRFREMEKWLISLGYPRDLIMDAILRAKTENGSNNSRNKANYINYITTFNPNNTNIFPCIKDSFEFLKISDETKEIFRNKNIRKCNKQAKNLKTFLTRAEFTDQKRQYKVNKCNRPRCKTCLIIIEGTDFVFENGTKVYINENMTCISQNVVYVMKCGNCTKCYIGETSDKLSMRMNVHRQQIRDTNLRHLFVSKHIANCAKDKDPIFTVMPFKKIINDDPAYRKTMEKDFITLHKPSLNRS
jgi:hypothetical protein